MSHPDKGSFPAQGYVAGVVAAFVAERTWNRSVVSDNKPPPIKPLPLSADALRATYAKLAAGTGTSARAARLRLAMLEADSVWD